MTNHVKIVAWLYIALGILGLIGAFVLFSILLGGGLLSGEREAVAVTAIVGAVVGGILGLLSLPGVIGGLGLLKYQGWARVLVLVLGAVNLPAFPLGTLLAAYTFYGLLNEESNRLFMAV